MENINTKVHEVITDNDLTINEVKSSELNFSKSELRFDSVESSITHKNYLDYLSKCWDSHLGVVLKPDFLWNIILTELAMKVSDNVEKYRDLFTTSNKKVEITVQTSNSVVLPLESIIEQLKHLCPTDVNTFLPSFSTSDNNSFLANCASFADMVSPYYNYSMYMCGISKVRIDGTLEDWELFNQNLAKMVELFPTYTSYFNNVSDRINSIIESYSDENLHTMSNVEFFRNIFELERCGSGGQVEVKGWIKDFFIETPRVGYIENYSSCVSKVEYKNLSTNESFKMYSGLFSSKIVSDYLEPMFGYMVYNA